LEFITNISVAMVTAVSGLGKLLWRATSGPRAVNIGPLFLPLSVH